MKKPVLVVMAAGMGSRYGGLKQIDPVDKEGHIIMDFSIFDAVKAGFEKVVFIIKKENEQDFRAAIGDRLSEKIKVSYVFQELTNLPEGYVVPEGRVKPWGTGHAIMSCMGEIDGPFVVINADDFYGSHAFQVAYDYLTTHQDEEGIYRTFLLLAICAPFIYGLRRLEYPLYFGFPLVYPANECSRHSFCVQYSWNDVLDAFHGNALNAANKLLIGVYPSS